MGRILIALAVFYSLPLILGLAAIAVRWGVDRLGDAEQRYRRKPVQIAK
ncbi:MAG: hypothetical protein ACKO1J_03575 [Tagaea sp.]